MLDYKRAKPAPTKPRAANIPSARDAPLTSVTWAGPEVVAEALRVLEVVRVLEVEVVLSEKSNREELLAVVVADWVTEADDAVAVVEGALSAGLGVVATAPNDEQQSAPSLQTLPSLQQTSPRLGR